MALRTVFIAALVALTACEPARPLPDAGGGGTGGSGGGSTGGGTGGSTGGGTGGGSTGGGTGGGATGGGTGTDGGVMTTIAGAKALPFAQLSQGARVLLTGVVVTAISTSYEATQGGCSTITPKGWYDWFWVADPASPRDGIYVYKYCQDLPTDYAVQIGDVLTIDGWIGYQHSYGQPDGYRLMVKGQFDFTAPPHTGALPLSITKTGTMAPLADNLAPAGFGDAMGGTVKPNKEYGGSRVHIAGPLTLTNPSPPAMKRVSAVPNDSVYFGFEVSGGVLVDNFKTYRSFTDGGTACDWHSIAIDGGADGGPRTITFPNGISGVWDTYTDSACEDGGTASGCRTNPGRIPGTPDANYTYVLYPMDCANDLAGQ